GPGLQKGRRGIEQTERFFREDDISRSHSQQLRVTNIAVIPKPYQRINKIPALFLVVINLVRDIEKTRINQNLRCRMRVQ
ncbi:hypothetical protein MLI36_024450, partial [Escherichia coli]|uniref:hypothetical protein n=3 Tax=Escherichia coli TaxID=562 RepID=UPI001CD7C935